MLQGLVAWQAEVPLSLPQDLSSVKMATVQLFWPLKRWQGKNQRAALWHFEMTSEWEHNPHGGHKDAIISSLALSYVVWRTEAESMINQGLHIES